VQLFSSWVLALYFFGAKILAQKYCRKRHTQNVDDIDTRGQFHQFFIKKTFLHAKIAKAQKDTDNLTEFLRFWDLGT